MISQGLTCHGDVVMGCSKGKKIVHPGKESMLSSNPEPVKEMHFGRTVQWHVPAAPQSYKFHHLDGVRLENLHGFEKGEKREALEFSFKF